MAGGDERFGKIAADSPLPAAILKIAQDVADAGGRALVVGGWVRDRLLGLDSKDVDLEIHGLDAAAVERVLRRSGEVIHVGRAFGVMRLRGLDADISLPRGVSPDSSEPSPRGARIDPDTRLAASFEQASRHRDLTLNSMGWEPLRRRILDPHGGRDDLVRGRLRATDPAHFGDDPVRALRVAQLSARFGLVPDDELRRLCAAQDLDSVAPERIFEELRKLLLKAGRPSAGFGFLRDCGLLRFFPELEAMVDVPQDPAWHPEGCVWTHTLMVVDEAARMREAAGDDALALMLAALCHDLGKPATTEIDEDGRVRSVRHERVGADVTRGFLERLRVANALIRRVVALVAHHLAPARFDRGPATPKAYRRLARVLAAEGVTMALLERVARADHLGRTTHAALTRDCAAMDRFLAAYGALADEAGPRDVVLGRHVLARGIPAGPAVGELLERCREIQDETGSTDPDAILDRALSVDSERSLGAPVETPQEDRRDP